jgi:hypothetical protein
MGQSYLGMGLAQHFCRPLLVWIFQIWPYPGQNPTKFSMYRPQAPANQASPWGHSPSSSAPCAVPMRLSRIGQHIKEESCARRRALLGVSSCRSSSVSRGVRYAIQKFTCLPYTYSCTQILNLVQQYEIMSSRAVAQPPAGRFTPILGNNDLAYGSR